MAVDLSEFATLAGNARDVVIAIDALGTVLAASVSAVAVMGYDLSLDIGRNIMEFIHPDDVALASSLLENSIEQIGQVTALEIRALHSDGTSMWVEALPRNLLSTHDVVLITIRDISQRREHEREQRAKEDRFRAVALAAPIAILSIDLAGNCQFVNQQWMQLSGQNAAQALNRGWLDVINRSDQRQILVLRDGVENANQGRMRLRIHDTRGDIRSTIGTWATLLDESGDKIGYVGTIQDITEREALEARLSHQATHDSLTGLPNRVILGEHLTKALASVRRSGEMIGVLFCDLDRFKVVNDSLGHDSGDRLLVSVADRLRSCVRAGDLLGRFGGDEFVIITSGHSDGESIAVVAERIRAAFDEPFEIGAGRPMRCTASLGVAHSSVGATPESLLRDADVAMYRAKENCRGGVAQFDERLRARALERLALERDLPHALANDELVLLYQPIVDAVSRQVRSVEALVRWDHPTRGRLAPEMFISVAEETGAILELGDWVLRRACVDLLDIADLKVNVNLSALQLHDHHLVDRVTRILTSTGFPPGRLVLEITESVLVADIEATIATLTRLKTLGIAIAVDDFGTGYSSLNYLSRLPVDSLKIDRSFVQGLGLPSGNDEIVRAVLVLAHALGLETTAEGVETVAQLETLQSLRCDLAQGFLFNQPLEHSALRELTSASSAKV